MRLQLKFFAALRANAVFWFRPSMHSRMIVIAENFQVLNTVIGWVTITVVDNLTLSKQSTQPVLHKNAVERVEPVRVPLWVRRLRSTVVVSTPSTG